MSDSLEHNLALMVKVSGAPMLLADQSLKVLTYSIPFSRSMLFFDGDIHSLFDGNALRRIKQSRKSGRPMKMTTKTEPFALTLYTNWLSIDEERAYLLIVAGSNQLYDANRRMSIAYSSASRAEQETSGLMSLLRTLDISEESASTLMHQARRINKDHSRLRLSLDILTDNMAVTMTNQNIGRIVRLCAQHIEKKLADRNIKINVSLPQDACIAPCDVKYFTMAVTECLTCLAYFTQENHQLSVEVTNQYPYIEITFKDPLFQIPEHLAYELLVGDVQIDGKEHCVGLYLSNTVIEKHKGKLSIDNGDKIGYSIRVSIPSVSKTMVRFEDSDDAIFSQKILNIARNFIVDL